MKNQIIFFSDPIAIGFRIKLSAILILSILLNINTIQNKYALDDEMVIVYNMNVHKGFEGIGNILNSDSYQGFLDFMEAKNPVSGGRYRPLSIITFAIEEELFTQPSGDQYLELRKKYNEKIQSGNFNEAHQLARQVREIENKIIAQSNEIAWIRHLIQILLFSLSMGILYYFLHYFLFPKSPFLAFLSTVLFLSHPIHTEVIANLKSRDEILSLLFISLSLIYFFRYETEKKSKYFYLFLLSAFFALLSKEYAIVFPVLCFSVLFLNFKRSAGLILRSRSFISISLLVAAFAILRFSITGGNSSGSDVGEVLNDPFLYADFQEKIGTRIYILSEYLKLLLIPHPLSSDYSYQHFPYLGLMNWKVLLSLIIWTGIIFITIKLWKKKHELTFPIIFFLSFFMLVNNLIFPIGATIGERLIYHSSLGFCIVIAWLFLKYLPKKIIVIPISLLVISAYALKTISRNPDWKNDFTLFTKDVKYVPNSALVNANAGSQYYNLGMSELKDPQHLSKEDSVFLQKYADTALVYLNKAIELHPRHVSSLINRAICYTISGKTEMAISDFKTAAAIFNGPHQKLSANAQLLLDKGKDLGSLKQFEAAAKVLKDASQIDPWNPEIWENLGGSEFMQGNFANASHAFEQAINLNPNLQGARQGYSAANNFLALQLKLKQDSLNPQAWLDAAKIYHDANFPELEAKALENSKFKMQNAKAKKATIN